MAAPWRLLALGRAQLIRPPAGFVEKKPLVACIEMNHRHKPTDRIPGHLRPGFALAMVVLPLDV